MASTALIQGASRGLGLQFCASLLKSSPALRVLASCRKPNEAEGLTQLKAMYNDRLHVLQMDMLDDKSIASAAEQAKGLVDGNGIDLLVNCSGMVHPTGKGETSLRAIEKDSLQRVMETNAFGPLLVAKHFSPFLAKGSDCTFGAGNEGQKDVYTGIIVNLSARVGSIGDNKLGGWYSYRLSKSALNAATKTLSVDLGRGRRKVISISLHPGTVETDLTLPFRRSIPPAQLLTTEQSIDSMLQVIANLTIKDTGKFYAFDGSPIVW